MRDIAKQARSLVRKSIDTVKTEGVTAFARKGVKFVYYRKFPERRKKVYGDILFINGCTLPHPSRYRVDHQVEQLRCAGMTADTVFYEDLSLDMLKYYRGFVFFRCPVTDTIRKFIETAKYYNKVCFFDVDDLVIDHKFTNQIKYVQKMSKSEKRLYDDGVRRMRETLELCDYGITTTERLAAELKSYVRGVCINRNTASDEMARRSIEALSHIQKDDSKVVMGYFSGSITHNDDFELILPAIIRLFEKYDNLYLKIAGILDIPKELEPFKDRIFTAGFMDWRLLPREIASCDINLAPLTNTIFNEAKSENKWTEASLVKVVTVASDLGAFRKVIKNGKTGVLAKDGEWFDVLDDLITNKDKREALGEAAYKQVLEFHTTVNTAHHLAKFIRSKLKRNIAFALPSTDISGGVNVILKHAEIVRRRGWDVTLIDTVDPRWLAKALKEYNYRTEIPGYNLIAACRTDIEAYFDTMVATLWSTVKYVKEYPNVSNRLYLVQGFETQFYAWGSGNVKFMANATYNDVTGLRYITISSWCRDWLKNKFGKEARQASNGIDLDYFPYRKRNFKGKIKILIEGDSRDEYKNTDEAFRIAEKLDPKKYEIHYLSYRREPKSWYRVDYFYNRVPYEEVGKIYAKCDILIKTSLVESFSYPPLEMMATGGLVVAVPNGGNAEYLRDGYNGLLYRQGDIEDGVSKVEALLADENLRNRFIKNGLETAKKYVWKAREKDILALYE